jgi:6-phosphogluconolactonase (cycloisomerase 2 family)
MQTCIISVFTPGFMPHIAAQKHDRRLIMKKTTSLGIIICIVLALILWGCGGGGGGSSTPTTKYYSYVTNVSDQTLSVFQMNPDTGSQTEKTPYMMEDSSYPFAIVAHPSMNLLYVTTSDGKIRVLEINTSTGAPTEVQSIATTGTSLIDITPDGKFLYTSNWAEDPGTDTGSKIYCYTVGDDGLLASSSELLLGQRLNNFKVGPDSASLFVTFRNEGILGNILYSFSINSTTGALAQLHATTLANTPYRIAFSGEYTYAGSSASNDLWRTSGGSDVADKQAIYPTCGISGAMTVVDDHLYTVNIGNNSVNAFAISQANGTLTQELGVAIPAGSNIWQITADPNGKYLYVFDQTTKDLRGFSINDTTGALTSMGSVGTTGNGPLQMAIVKTH